MPLRSGPSTRTPRPRLVLALLAALLGLAAPVPAAAMAGMSHESASPTTSSSDSSWNAGNAMFRVGTAHHPLIADGPRGPLWSTTRLAPVGSSSHGTFAQLTVARELEQAAKARAAKSDPVGHRASVMTTAQATKKLSKSCQKLIKAKAGKLSKKDRKKRTACLKQRTALVAASKKPASTSPGGATGSGTTGAATTTPAVPGVTAPGPTVAGPTPTNAPTPAATTPAAASPVGTTPAPTTPDKVYALTAKADAVKYNDPAAHPYSLSRSTVPAGPIAFGLENTDSQEHNLAIAPSDGHGNVTGAVKAIVTAEANQNMYAPNTITLATGYYMLLCTVPGHGAMAVQITVT